MALFDPEDYISHHSDLAPPKMSATLIVAATAANGIGIIEGATAKLPWRLPKEMAYFARVTSSASQGKQNAVVMGRRTWQSIPSRFRPLNNRLNVVLSRNESFLESQPGCGNLVRSNSLREALRLSGDSVHRIFIIGGASVYAEALQLQDEVAGFLVDRILLTRILSPAFEDCNVHFPDIWHPTDSPLRWERSSHQELEKWLGLEVSEGVQEEKGVQYEFQMWTRGATPAAVYAAGSSRRERRDNPSS